MGEIVFAAGLPHAPALAGLFARAPAEIQKVVRETYEGAEGLIEHRMHVAEALSTLFKEFADHHAVTIYGNASQLVDMTKSQKDVSTKWYSFLRRLES